MLVKFLSVFAGALALTSIVLVNAHEANAGGTCHEGNGVTEQRGTAVEMRNNCFNATVTRVDEGATVTFTNQDDVAHTVTGAAFSWGDGKNLFKGDAVRHTFDKSGVYVYSCLLHPGMAAAIVVGDGQGDGATSVTAAGFGNTDPDAAPAAEASSAASSDDSHRTAILAFAIVGAVALVLGAAGGAFVFSRASASRRTAEG